MIIVRKKTLELIELTADDLTIVYLLDIHSLVSNGLAQLTFSTPRIVSIIVSYQ